MKTTADDAAAAPNFYSLMIDGDPPRPGEALRPATVQWRAGHGGDNVATDAGGPPAAAGSEGAPAGLMHRVTPRQDAPVGEPTRRAQPSHTRRKDRRT